MTKRILTWLVFIIFLTSSFDIFFNLSLGGFNIRTCYLASFAFIFIYALQYPDSRKFSFVGAIPFLIWTCFVIGFFYNTQFITRNVGYIAWLIFNVLVCYSLYKFSDKVSSAQFLRMYIYGFWLIALAGICQFLLSSVGINVLVTSYWNFNKFPRVNAFSYEPSYFATYLLIGFVFLYHLTQNNFYLFGRRKQLIILFTLIAAILLSTSRMGIIFVLAIFFYDFVLMAGRALYFRKISKVNLIISAVFIFGFLGTIVNIALNDKLRARYLSGTGVESTPSHSRDTRIRQMMNVYNVFIHSPIEGFSLGGIAPAIATLAGDKITDQKKAKEYEGLNIFLETLAATGIFGFVFFLWWLFRLFQCNIQLSRKLKERGFEEEHIILNGLRKALIAEFLILVLSQNILRPYLWILIGMTSAMYFRFKPLIFEPQNPLEFNTEIELESA